MRTRALSLLGVACLLVGAVACSGGGDDSGSASGDDADESSGDAAPSERRGGHREGSGGLPAGDPIQAGRSIIATAELVPRGRGRPGGRAPGRRRGRRGGRLPRPAGGEPGRRASTTLTLRVPTERFASVMGELESIGEVRAQRIDTEDVTEQVVDLESRIASARTSVARCATCSTRAATSCSSPRSRASWPGGRPTSRRCSAGSACSTTRWRWRRSTSTCGSRRRWSRSEGEDPLPGFFGGLRGGWDGFVTSASVVVDRRRLRAALPRARSGRGGVGWLWSRRLRIATGPAAAVESTVVSAWWRSGCGGRGARGRGARARR